MTAKTERTIPSPYVPVDRECECGSTTWGLVAMGFYDENVGPVAPMAQCCDCGDRRETRMIGS